MRDSNRGNETQVSYSNGDRPAQPVMIVKVVKCANKYLPHIMPNI